MPVVVLAYILKLYLFYNKMFMSKRHVLVFFCFPIEDKSTHFLYIFFFLKKYFGFMTSFRYFFPISSHPSLFISWNFAIFFPHGTGFRDVPDLLPIFSWSQTSFVSKRLFASRVTGHLSGLCSYSLSWCPLLWLANC